MCLRAPAKADESQIAERLLTRDALAAGQAERVGRDVLVAGLKEEEIFSGSLFLKFFQDFVRFCLVRFMVMRRKFLENKVEISKFAKTERGEGRNLADAGGSVVRVGADGVGVALVRALALTEHCRGEHSITFHGGGRFLEWLALTEH